MTSVFCTSTSTPIEGSTRENSSTASTEGKNRAAGAAIRLGNLDAHDAELEQLVDEAARDLRVLVHFTDERANAGVGELPRCHGK